MSSCTVFVFSSLMEYLIINIVYLNHNNYTAYSSSANYNGNYYTGLSSDCLNTYYLNTEQQQQHCNNSRCECNLSKRRLKRQIKKSLKQRQKTTWFNRWFPTSAGSQAQNLDKDIDNRNNNGTFVWPPDDLRSLEKQFSIDLCFSCFSTDINYPITNLNHFQQTPLSNGISTNNINQNVPTNSPSLTGLANLKDNNNIASSSANAGGSAAVITQTANCEHCAADHRRRHSKDSLCRRHVQCIHLAGSTDLGNVHPNNSAALNSVITTIDGATATTAGGTNVTSSLATNSNLNLTSSTVTRQAATNQLPDGETNKKSAKKKAPLKCAEHNLRVRFGLDVVCLNQNGLTLLRS